MPIIHSMNNMKPRSRSGASAAMSRPSVIEMAEKDAGRAEQPPLATLSPQSQRDQQESEEAEQIAEQGEQLHCPAKDCTDRQDGALLIRLGGEIMAG